MARSVTPPSRTKPNGEMNTIGLLVAALTAVVLVPILPFLALVRLLEWIRDYDRASQPGRRV